jgi:shikimate dehydrogenase
MPKLAVLGQPVSHSRSPAMHEAAYRAAGLADWRYQRLPVPPDLFAETTRALGEAGFVGANVTIPHKLAARDLADDPQRVRRVAEAAGRELGWDERRIDAEVDAFAREAAAEGIVVAPTS